MRLPLMSGKASALTLVLCFGISAGLVYAFAAPLHVPAWVRWEIIVGLWWLVWLVALTRLLYDGVRVSDDHRMGAPRSWFGTGGPSWNFGPGDIPLTNAEGCGEGCATALAVVVALIALVAISWLLIEVIIPVLAFLLYLLIRGMLARVVNDFHGCTGNFGRSLRWGATWATAYTAPLAILIWLGHILLQAQN